MVVSYLTESFFRSLLKESGTYTVKCSNEQCKLGVVFVQPCIVNTSLALGTLEDNLRDYFIVEALW